MSIDVIGKLVNPFGGDSGEVVIRVTAIATVGQTPVSAEAEYTVTPEGNYSFKLENGYYNLEIKYTDEYVEVQKIIVDEGIPSPTDLLKLIDYIPELIPPIILPDAPEWDNLHDDLRNDVDTSTREKLDTLTHMGNHTTELKQLIENERLEATIAEHNTFNTSGSIEHVHQTSVYEDKYLNQSSQESTSVTSTNGHIGSTAELYDASNGKVHIVTTSDQHTSESSKISSMVLDDSGVVDSLTIDAPNISHTELLTTSGVTTTKSEILSGSSVLKEDTSELNVGAHTAKITSSQKTSLDNDSVAQAEQERSLEVYNKSLYEKQSIIAGTSKVTKNPDVYDITAEDGTSVFEVDTVNKEVNIRARLNISNPEDFVGAPGDTIFQVYQYSSNNVTWHEEWMVGDKWRRHATSTNGVIGQWSAGYYMLGEDGRDGDTYYNQYQYSTNSPTGPWHDEYIDEDRYRRWRTVSLGSAPTEWQVEVMRGSNGEPGEIVTISYQYSTDGFDPWHSDFLTGDHFRRERMNYFHVVEDVPNNPYYSTEWSSPVQLVPIKDKDYFDGEKGTHGAGSYVIKCALADRPVGNTEIENAFQAAFGKASQDNDIVSFQGDSSVPANSQFLDQYLKEEGVWGAFLLQVDGNAIINGTLAAEKLKAATITGDKISASTTITAGSGNSVAGMSGTATQGFWAGHATPNSAPFRVDRAGNLVATQANITGAINANTGSFTGTIAVGQMATSSGWGRIYGSSTNGATQLVFAAGSNNDWKWGVYGNGRMVIRGTTNQTLIDIDPVSNTAKFEGTVYADKIVGDVVSAKEYSTPSRTLTGVGSATFISGTINNVRTTGTPRTFFIPTGISISAKLTASAQQSVSASVRAVMVTPAGEQELFSWAFNFNGGVGGSSESAGVTRTPIVSIGAGKYGAFNIKIYVDALSGGNLSFTAATSGSKCVAQIFKTGAELS